MTIDLKVFTKILPQRLAPQLQMLIHYDQDDFLQRRETRDGTTRAIDLNYKNQRGGETCLLSTDAEKAFDCVDRSFMLQTLEAIGIGGKMRTWISSLFTFPIAEIRANEPLSNILPIRNGTRQGCPLLPFIVDNIAEAIPKSGEEKSRYKEDESRGNGA